MSDERYDESADMRLLEHRRQSLGLREAESSRWRTRLAAPMAHVIVEEQTAARQGAVLVSLASASPSKGLIPGAVVTVSIASTNEGTTPTSAVKIVLPLPREARFQPGSLHVDGRAARENESDALFGSGFEAGVLAPGQRKTLVFKLGIGPGLHPLALVVQIVAPQCAVVGPRGIRLERSSAPQGFTRLALEPEPQAEGPFYELDPQETVEAEALDAMLDAAREPVPAPQPAAPVISAAVVPPSAPRPAPGPAAAFSEHLSAVLSAPLAPEPRPVAVPSPPRMYAAVPRHKLATLRQFFVAERSFGITAHYLLATALSCCRTGNDATALVAFMDAQERLLTRAMIARKMGRTVQLQDLAAPLPAFPSEGPTVAPELSDDTLVMARELAPSERATLTGTTANLKSPAFVRAAQLAVGLLPTLVLSGPDPLAQQRALAAYATRAGAEINRLFVRSRLDRRADLFGASSHELDAAAKTLLETLSVR